MIKKLSFIFIVAVLGAGLAFWLWPSKTEAPRKLQEENPSPPVIEESRPPVELTEGEEPELPVSLPDEPLQKPESVLISDVPFTVQAPFGEWNIPLFQDACEEASLTMVHYWQSGKTLTKEEAKKEITALASLEEKIFGHFVDTSVEDTLRLWQDYYKTPTGKVQRDIHIHDMRKALDNGELVVVPADGRKLKNPNFTQPGPPRHMLVVIGYDVMTKEFITNDPGTRNGKDYRYAENVLFDAILDYPTGKHKPATSTEKVMLTFAKE